MTFRLSELELDSYLAKLRKKLSGVAGRLAPQSLAYLGRSTEDAVQDVIADVIEFLRDGVPLKLFKKNNSPIHCLDDLTTYACRRLRTAYDTHRKAGARDAERTTNRSDEIYSALFIEAPPDEHEYYDFKFFDDLTRALEKDVRAYQLVTLILNCHILPGTKDLDICDNTALAEELGCEPLDVRLARNRIHTVKNHLIAERKTQDEGPSK